MYSLKSMAANNIQAKIQNINNLQWPNMKRNISVLTPDDFFYLAFFSVDIEISMNATAILFIINVSELKSNQ